MLARNFDAHIAEAVIDAHGEAWFALGTGGVARIGDLSPRMVHAGAVLCAAPHPGGWGIVTGGDDGRVVWSRGEGETTLFERAGRWVDALAASPASGLFAVALGREVAVRDTADPAFERRFTHERSVAALAFDAKGRRLAAATYGGVALWYARIVEQKPQMLKWAGAHIGVAFSPDGRFVVSAMQENALHGWRLSDGKDMRMGGYPAKVRSLAFLSKGRLLATSGAAGAVVWPFGGADGPMGREAAEVGFREGAAVTRVAAAPGGGLLAIGRGDGSAQAAEVAGSRLHDVIAPSGAAVSALAVSPDGATLACGDEGGLAHVVSL